jgi:glycosyltransferase involved in cell wall biosynthesis
MQTLTDFECILIDDGSFDRCPAICDEYAAKDDRIIVIHQKNAGPSAARKKGLDKAGGEWITFVDSDDWLEPNALELLFGNQRRTGADVIIGSYRRIYRLPKSNEKTIFRNYSITDKKEMTVDFLKFPYKFPWGKLFRASLFSDVVFCSDFLYGEDAVQNIQTFHSPKCKRVDVISDIVYNYNKISGGLTHRRDESKNLNFSDAWIFIKQFLENVGYFGPVEKKWYYRYMFNAVYPKLFISVPKRVVIKKLKENRLPFLYFPATSRMIMTNMRNLIYFINVDLYKRMVFLKSKMRNRIKAS